MVLPSIHSMTCIFILLYIYVSLYRIFHCPGFALHLSIYLSIYLSVDSHYNQSKRAHAQAVCPSPGITRLQRWERAQLHGLNPPQEIRELLMHTNNDPQFTLRWRRHTCTYIDTNGHQVPRGTAWKYKHTQDTCWWWCIFSIMKCQHLLAVYCVIHTTRSQQYHKKMCDSL